jgi:glycosyl transferase family 25
MLSKYFDKIYCINLDRRTDRWEETLIELKKWGLEDKVTRFSAVDGSTIPQINNKINKGELGLVETHIKIITEAKNNNYKNILILEDDITFTDEITKIEFYFEQLPKTWEILWFGGNHNTHVGATINKINENILKCHQTYSTHSIAFNEKIYDLVLNLLEKKEKPVDVYYSDIQKIYECYSFYPSIALQRPSYSDIQNRMQDNRWLF